MKAILKPFFALCGLVALSTALSADSRLFPAGGGGAGWGEPGFLYSDYLQTAAASGREVEFQGSFVLDNRRPFLAELGTAFPGRVVDEVKSLPLREWGLGYVFEKRRPAHQRALLERGWRLADWLAEETLMAATESSRGGGLIRTLEFDLQSELGGRRAQVGLNVLGALRESNDEAIAWQFRGFKSSGGLGGNTGLIWRRAVANDRALAGANVFLDYETYADENFWRGSAGAELRSAWADVFGNVYRGFSDDVKKNNRTTYTADGYDVELNVHSPELPWLVGEVAYYNFEGKAGDKDDDGVRFGLRFNPLTDLELGVEYDNGDSDDDGKKKWAARIRYSGEFGGVLKAQYRPSTNSGNFEPRDWFFAPAEREYSQRIRKSGGDSGFQITVAGVTEGAFPLATYPIELRGALSLDITSTAQLPRVINVSGGTVILSHKTGQVVSLFFPRTRVSVITRSTVAFSLDGGREVFSLLEGQADIVMSTLSRGMLVVEQRVTAAATSDDRYRQITLSVATRPVAAATLLLTVNRPPANANIDPARDLPLPILVPVAEALGTVGVVAVTNSGGTPTNLTAVNFLASVELANDNSLTDTSPPSYYKGAGASPTMIVLGTLQTSGGGGAPYTSSKVVNSGDLLFSGGVVSIPTSAIPATGDGKTLTLQIMVNDNPSDTIGAQTDPQIVGFTVVYREIVPLAASLPGFSGIPSVYGVLGDSARKVVATAAVVGSGGAITYSPIDGALRLDAGHVVYIPAGNPPAAGSAQTGGNLLTLNSEIRQAASGGVPAMTVTLGLTVRYIGIPAVGANLNAIAPAISTGQNSFDITAQAGDTGRMEVLNVVGTGGAGGGFTMRMTDGDLSFDPSNGRVYISQSTTPRPLPYSVVIAIDDLGTGATETPTYTLTVRVQYDSVEVIRVNFNDPDGLVTVYGLQGQTTVYANVAQVETGGGFGAITVGKVGSGGVLDLRNGTEIFIPQGTAPTGQDLAITVSGNDSEASDPNGITDAATAILTLEYAQVPTLNATFLRVSPRNGQVGTALPVRVLTVGMTQAINAAFTVAKVMAEGGVGGNPNSEYTYTRAGGIGNLSVNPEGEVLIAANTQPGADQRMEIIVRVDDTGTNSQISPAFLASLTVLYNTIGIIGAEVMDTRPGATPATLPDSGGKVYFISGGATANQVFGRVNIFGGLGNQHSDYEVAVSNDSGLAYDQGTGNLSMTKCGAQTPKTIRLTINDKNDDGGITEPFVFNFSVVSGGDECLSHVSADVEDLSGSGTAVAGTLLRYGLEAVNAPSDVAVATIEVSGGAGDLTAAKTSGELNLDGVLSGGLLTVEIPAGTTPKAVGNANNLVLVAVVNDANANGGFLTDPATVSVTANYVAVPSVVLNLNHPTGHANAGNAIADVVTVYGVESATNDATVAAYAASGGASGANVAAVLHSDTTENSFAAISGASGDLKLNLTFPAFDAPRNVIAAVSANDTGGTQAHTDATPEVVKRATVRLLPVLAAVEEGGNIVEVGSADNVVAPTSPSATEANFTVYVLAGERYAPPFAQVSAAAVTRNAGVAGASALRIKAPERHADSTPDTSGLLFNGGNPVAQVRIAPGATPTSGGADLKLVLEYEDEGFDAVADLTESRTKTVNVKYFEVAAFEPKVRNAAGNADLTDTATVYAGAEDDTEKVVAKLMKDGGADGNLVVGTQSGDTTQLLVKPNGDVVLRENVRPNDKLFTVTVEVDDPAGAAGSVTETETLAVTVEYLISRDVIANFVPIAAGANDKHFIGALQADGTRTVFLDATESRAALPLFQLRAQSGTGEYTYDSTGTGFNLAGFVLAAGDNNRVLSLEDSVTGGAKAYATVQVDDSGNGADQTEPATAAVTVEVKLVTAIAAELLVPANVPGGAPARTTLGGLYVRSAAAAESSSVYIASVVARGGVEEFTYTRQSESSAELLLNADGQVHLAQNYTPDGSKTLSILIAVNDSGDGSTLTDAAMMTLQFVLAETIEATVFLRGGVYLPGGSGNEVVVSDSAVATVRVKTADYGNEHTLFGVKASGGLGKTPAYSIARATGGNENGLVARVINPDGYPAAVLVKQGASGSPKTFGITAVINESTTDPNDLTPPATISVTVLYTAVDQIVGAFQEEDGTAIVGRHVVAKQGGAETENYQVAKITPSGGVGGDGNGFGYTFTQDTPGDLIVDGDGKVLVKGGVVPAIGLNLSATVKINDTGNWSHVSDELVMEITVLYSSEVPVNAAITDTRSNVPAPVQTILPNRNPPQTVFFNAATPHANIPFALMTYTSGLPTANDDFDVVASLPNGLNYDATNKHLRIDAKCGDDASANKSIRLVVDDKPDPNNVSKPLTVDITVHSGAAECIAALEATPRDLSGQLINADVVRYAVEGSTLAARMAVATVLIAGGAPEFTSSRSGGDLELDGNGANLLTVYIPADTSPAAGASGNELDIAIAINDDVDKGGFLTPEAEVKMTVNYIAVARHGQFTADKVADVEGDVASGMLTVRRVAADSANFNILTNIKGAIPNKESVSTALGSSYVGILYTSGNLQMDGGQIPDGRVRVITLRVFDNTQAVLDERAQTDARPDRLFTISVRYEGELEGAAYDSENTANEITAPVNRYVEQGDSNVSVAVASLSVRGGTPDYSYSLTGDLELNADNTTVQIKASANPADPATPLTARIVIDDTGRTDTAPLTVDLTANYILIDGLSDLQLVRDGQTQAEDLSGETVYPKIVAAQSSSAVGALSGLAFKTTVPSQGLTKVSGELLYTDDATVVEIAGGVAPAEGNTLALVLRGSDGEDTAIAKARNDRLYTLRVRYMQELTAKPYDETSGGDVINATREIRVTEAEADDAHFVARISVEGGAGGNVIAVGGDVFEIASGELRIKADVTPGDLATGKLLTATVSVNDNESAVGGPETGAVEILVTANYITLPPVEASFVEGRNGEQAVPTSAPVTVYSAWTPSDNAPATVAATAKATVGTRTSDTFTFHKIGTEGKLEVDVSSGAVMLAANRPQFGRFDLHTITVEFRAATNAVATQQTLTVRHQMVHPIIAAPNSFQSRPNCHPGDQINGTNDLEIVMAAGEEGSVWNAGGQCSYLAFSRNVRVYNVDAPRLPIARTVKTDDGLNLGTRNADHIVGVNGNTFTYTAERRTLSIVIAYNDTGPGSHVTDEYLRTVYVVFPGLPKIEAALETPAGAAINKELTVYVAATDANAKLVATVEASGGAGSPYSYTGTRLGGDSTTLLVNDDGEISVPAGFVAKVSPGDNFQLEVAVDDSGQGATTPAKVTLTLQYIKTSGPLVAEAVYETPDVYDASATTFYQAKDVALTEALNVASIRPSGGIPDYSFAIEGNADSSELEITGSGNERVVRLKSGATPSAATSEARRRMITVRVTDTGDVGNSIQQMTMDVVVSVNFVEVAAHANLVVENGGNDIGSDFVVVRPASQTGAVAVADKVAVADASLSESTDEAADGLSFVSAGDGTLEIDANQNPPTGNTLSIVLIATDGNGDNTDTAAVKAQKAARQDRLYTVSVRYVPSIEARVEDSSNALIAAVVELTVIAGNHVVGSIAASGGVSDTYTYTPTALNGSENLEVDADGSIKIPTGLTPLPGDGRSITVAIAVNDLNTADDNGETPAANVQITVKYVLLEDLALTAKDAGGNNVGAEASLGTFYLRDGASTDSQVLVGSVEASGGIQGYTYARKGTGGDLTFDPQTRQLHIPNNTSAADPDTTAATLLITLEVTDSQDTPVTKDLTVRAVFVKVSPHGDLTIAPESGITPNSRNEYVVVRPASHTNAVDVANITAPQGDTVSKTGGAAELELTSGNLRIVNTSPTGQTITAILTQTDGGDADDLTDEKGARPDRIHQIAVRYIPALAAEARDAAGNAALNAPIVITSKAGLRPVARIVASGGTSDSYSYAIENLHPAGNDLIVGSSDGIVSIPAAVQPQVGGIALTVRITANDSGDDNDKTDPASALVTVMYHLLESPEIEAQDKDGTAALAAPVNVYQLSGVDLAANVPVAKVVGSKGTSPYTFAIFGTNANGMEVDANTGNIVLKSGESTTATGSAADRVITVRLTDSQSPVETADATITVRFEAVAPHGDLTFIAETGVTRNTDSEYVVVQAGTPSAAVPVLNFASVDSVSRTAGDAPLVFVSGSPNRLEIAANTVPTGQTITAEITQTDGDNNDLERTRPDRTYTVSVRYIPALAAEVRNANGVGALVLTDGTLVIEKESAASLNIASIAVSGGTSDTYTYSIDNKHTDNELEVSNDGIVYIPASVAPLPSTGLELTVEISANDTGDDNTATPAAVASITVRYVMDPGLGGQVQVAADNTPAASPTVIYRLVNDAAPAEGLDTGLKVVGLRGDTNAYTYANAGNTNPDGLAVDANTGVISILSGQTPDSNQSKVRLLTVKISGVRNGNPREALVTVSVQFLGVGRFGNLQIDNNGVGDAPTNSEGEYVVVRDVSSTGQVIVINSFGIARSDTVVKSAGAPELEVSEVGGGNQLRIKSGTVPGGQPPVSGGLTLVAQIKASDDDSDAQDLARPDNDNYFLTVIYLANIAPTLEDAGGTAFPDLTDVDISGPTGGASLFVGNIAATGGDTGESGRYTYNKASGDLELDTTNGQVFISGKTPTAGEGEPLFIEVDVNDTGGDNSDQTDAKRIRIDVDYILDPGLSGQVQNLDGTEATSTPIIYRLAGNAAPSGGLATGLKVAGQRGDSSNYQYAIEGTDPNPDGLSVDASSGVISIVASQTPDSDVNKVRLLTVKISGNRNGSPSEALVTVSVIFRAVNEISGQGFQIQSNDRCSIPRKGGSTFQQNVLPLAEEGTEYSHTTACQFFTLIDESRGSFGFRGGSGGFDKRVVGTPNGLRVDQRGTDLRIQLSSQPVLYTAERLTLDIVIAYNDNGPAKDLTAEHRKTIEIVLPGVPSVDAVLNDEGGNAIADIAAIEKRGPGNLSVFVGNIVASGGDGNLAIVKDATDGGDLGIDNNGQVYIPDSVQPAAGAGNQLHLLVNINDDGANSGLTKQKQLRIEVDYILQLGLAGQTQDLEDNNVSGEHVVYRQAGVAVPTEGLTVVKVVGERGTSPYTYAVEGDASGSKLVLHTASGSVAIAANETASNQLLELTVRISDNASPPATALHTVSIRFNSVAPHADLTRELAAGVTQNSAGEYVVAQDGAQTQSFQVLTKIKSDEGAAVNRIGTDPIELQYVFNTFSDEGNLKIGGNTAPTGQTLSFQVVATDGNGEDDDSAEVKAQKTARQDRTFDIAVRYLSHLQTPTLQDRNDADIDLSSAVLVTAAGGASVYVGDIAASGGTGEYTFGKDATTGGLTVSPAGQVYLRSDAVPTSEGAAFAMTVNVNDSGKDNEVTNGTAIEITVNYILQETGPALPLLEGDLVVYQELGTGFERRICPGDACQLPLGTPPPTIIPTDPRMTVWGLNSDTARQFIFNAGFSVPVVITDGSGSDFEVGEAVSTPTGTRYRVYLKQENIKRWGQELQARLVVRDSANTREQLVTVKVLLSERLPDSALTVGIRGASNHGTTPGSRTNTNASRPMQFNLPAGYDPDTDTKYPTAPAFQTIADFPGITVQGLVVNNFKGLSYRGVRATATVDPILALGISRYGDFFWDEDTKDLKRRGVPIPGGNPRYYVELMDPGANPKIIPAIVNFRATSRPLAPLAWQTSPPSTISPSGNTSFEVKAGAQARNYSPYRDMVAEVNAPFVISNMRTTRAGGNDWRFHFDVSLQSGASAGAHTANIVVRDRGYTSFEPLTHTATATK